MRLLVLGGTVFLGRHLVEEALVHGHEVTLFNRGKSRPGLFSQLECLQGDRDGGLKPLRGRRWDAVVDTSGYLPRVVRQSVELLREATDHYTFVSSISVYGDVSALGITEDGSIAAPSRPDSEDIPKDYGALKFLCEEVVRDGFGSRALNVRPGLIVGPWDPSDRFTYWPYRIARGGDVLLPGRPDRRVQFIDARDLAAWILRMVEGGQGGTFNADGPEGRETMGGLADACLEASLSGARLHWTSDEFLAAEGVGEWMELPLWVRETPEQAGFFEVDCSAALRAGLRCRPTLATVKDTLAWHETREPYRWERTGLDPEKERRLLDRWMNASR
jgi:2'-hydroxyisoflavone reductase